MLTGVIKDASDERLATTTLYLAIRNSPAKSRSSLVEVQSAPVLLRLEKISKNWCCRDPTENMVCPSMGTEENKKDLTSRRGKNPSAEATGNVLCFLFFAPGNIE